MHMHMKEHKIGDYMKKIIAIIIVGGVVLFIDAQLRIRQRNPIWRDYEYQCCADNRSAIVPYSAADAEEEVRELEQEVNDDYDKGYYQATYGKKRRLALDIESHLGYTVPDDSLTEDDSFDQSYDDDL